MKKDQDSAVRELAADFALDLVVLVRLAVVKRVLAELDHRSLPPASRKARRTRVTGAATRLPQAVPAAPIEVSQDDQPGDEPDIGQSNYDVDIEVWE